MIFINCYLCEKEIHNELTFENLFKVELLCESCLSAFNVINFEESCPVCGNEVKCCEPSEFSNKALFISNKKVMDYISKIKFKGDAELLQLFKKEIRMVAKKYFQNYLCVPIPLSKERFQERGFNQALEIAKMTSLKICNCLERLDNMKQSKKTLNERKKNPPLFRLVSEPNNKNILLVDDIYTTGSTLTSAAKLFGNDYRIKCFTLIRVSTKQFN